MYVYTQNDLDVGSFGQSLPLENAVAREQVATKIQNAPIWSSCVKGPILQPSFVLMPKPLLTALISGQEHLG